MNHDRKSAVTSSGKPTRASGVTIGNVSGGITGSIIAGGDVSGTTITFGDQSTSADKAPTFDEVKQLLAEIQQELAAIATQSEALQAVSPAAPFTIQGAAQSVQVAAQQVDPTMQPETAKSVQKQLAESATLLSNILDGAKSIAEKAGGTTGAVQQLVEKLEPVVMKVGVATMWVAKLWLVG